MKSSMAALRLLPTYSTLSLMDHLSPHAVTRSRSYVGSLELPGASKVRGLGDIDDSSSIITSTSVSSTSKELRDKQCKNCKEPGKATRPLFRCGKCKCKWHENCHNPAPTSSDFICSRCRVKMGNAPSTLTAGQASTTASNPYAPQPASSKDITPKVMVCEKCKKPILRATSSGRPLCKVHEIEEKHMNAIKLPPAPQPTSTHRSFNKSKLYPTRPDDKIFITKPRKRKRRISGEVISNSGSRLQTSPKDKHIKGTDHAPNNTISGDSFLDEPRNEHRRQETIGHVRSAILHSNRESPSSVVPKISSTRNLESEVALNPELYRLDSARATPQPLAAHQDSPEYSPPPEDESPEYSPPPPAVPEDDSNPWEEPRLLLSPTPSSQVEQELQHDADSITHPMDTDDMPPIANDAELEGEDGLDAETLAVMNQFSGDCDGPRYAPALPAEASMENPTPTTSHMHGKSLIDDRVYGLKEFIRRLKLAKDEKVEQHILDRLSREWNSALKVSDKKRQIDIQAELLSHTKIKRDFEVEATQLPDVSRHISEKSEKLLKVAPTIISHSDLVDAVSDSAIDMDEPFIPPNASSSSKVNNPRLLRDRYGKNFKPSALDIFLTKQRENAENSLPPEPRELLRTQDWAAIDPRTAWQEPLPPSNLDQKKKEILERSSSRKANFGKLITPEIRQQRTENGWDVNQTCDIRDDEETSWRVKAMQEFFGVANIEDFVPSTFKGALAMKEREQTDLALIGPARRRKKVEPRIFPVMG